MSEDLLKHLQADNDRLRQELSNANAESKKYRLSKKAMAEELNKVKTEHESYAKELESLKKSPSTLAQEVEKLRGELRQRDHRTAFEKVAKELKVKDGAIDDLWTLSGYKADKDDVDVEALKGLITSNVEKRPYFLAEQEAPAKPVLNPGPAMGRGKPAEGVSGFRMSAADAADPTFMQRHQREIAQAAKDGNLLWDK